MYGKSVLLRLSTTITTACAALSLCAAAPAHAQQTLAPQIIDLRKMTDEQIGPPVPNVGTLRSKTLVALPDGTVSIQSGDVPKHTHAHSVEIQYVIAGHGKFWLGDKQYDIHPGDLIVIPENTVHAGSLSKNSRLKVLAIKLPPQQAGDMHLAP